MFVFRKIWRASFSWNTRSEIRPFALLPTNSRLKSQNVIKETLLFPHSALLFSGLSSLSSKKFGNFPPPPSTSESIFGRSYPTFNKGGFQLCSGLQHIQNNYIKFTGFTFRLDVTRFLLQRKFFKPENSFAVYDQPYTPLLHFQPLNCTLNGTGN